MSLHKTILRSDGVRRILCRLAAQYIRLVHATGRWTVLRGEIPRAFWDAGRPFILAFWHGRLMMMPYSWPRGTPIHMMVSQHRDGRLIAETVAPFGIRTVAGSSTRGGSGAVRGLLKALKSGECVGLTPDGPQGPRMRTGGGIVQLARISGVPIIPAAFGVNRRRVLSTWDSFVVAAPFGRGVFVWGEPIEVPRDADDAELEAARLRIEESLNVLTAEADALFGLPAIEPASAEPLPAGAGIEAEPAP